MSHSLPRPRANHPFLRRGTDTLQIGLQRQTAARLEGLGEGVIRALLRLDGSVTRGHLLAAVPELDEHLRTLERLGLIEDSVGDSSLSHVRRTRLEHEHHVLAAALGSSHAADEVLGRRADTVVGIRGSDRVAAMVAVGLACAGIGTVAILGPDHPVSLGEITPVGPFEPDVGWVEQVSEAVRRQGAHSTLARSQRMDLVVLAHSADVQPPWTDPELADDLVADDIVHYSIAVSGRVGRIGPLVIPGRTACLRCLDLCEADRDRAWPALLDQVRLRHWRTRAQDGALASLCSASAVQDLLGFLDAGPDRLQTRDTSSCRIFDDSEGSGRIVSVTPHPLCGCGWGHLPHTMDL